MENLKELNCIELCEEELVQISGGMFWKWVSLIYRANIVRTSINEFVDGWNSVECGCAREKEIAN
jgi:hypothetical protein